MANFNTPGVYTTETDLTFSVSSAGLTTLGIAGETTKGPAFQPIFIQNYTDFKSFFGGTNPEIFEGTNIPKYELPYIAKSYLTESNQLFVTRVLGFSGYDAGLSWAITLDAALDQTTVTQTGITAYNSNFINYTVSANGQLTINSISDAIVDDLNSNNLITPVLNNLIAADLGDVITLTTAVFYKPSQTSNVFLGATFTSEVISLTTDLSGNTIGELSGVVTTFSGTSYQDVENKVVALLRSKGVYNGNEQLLFHITSNSDIEILQSPDAAANNPLADFILSGNSSINGSFAYSVSFDRTKTNYLPKVLGKTIKDKNSVIYVEELYENMFRRLLQENKVNGIKLSLTNYNGEFNNYKQRFSQAVTPYVVSELRGNEVLRLFRLHTISDGNSSNEEIKISITNIRFNERTFDVVVRSFFDNDDKPIILERFTNLTMDKTSANYIGRRIGTIDDKFVVRSRYIIVELNNEIDADDAFPAGFMGYPIRDYNLNGNTSVGLPDLMYKQTYNQFENKKKFFLGLSSQIGVDQDFFDYKGIPNNINLPSWNVFTKGFHMDVDASTAIINENNTPIQLEFSVGNAQFRSEIGVQGTDYEKLFARKFTFAPYGGFDGWDIYRKRRTNTDNYTVSGNLGQLGTVAGNFSNISLSNGDTGISSDYYAYLEAIRTFANPNEIPINVLTTPGIDTFDHTNLVEETIDMIETERGDSIYIVNTPDTDASGDILTAEDVTNRLDGEFDSNYVATYFPWVQVNDDENNVLVWVSPTKDVVRNIAFTDKTRFSWFAVAGIDRGDVRAIRARKKLTQAETDELYPNRINPILTFTSEGIKIWGNRNMQTRDSALNRLNVRRLLLTAKSLITNASRRLVFDQNDDIIRDEFLKQVNPILNGIRSNRGLIDFRVIVDRSPESLDRLELLGRIFIKPTRSLEFILVDFTLTPTNVSFDDVI